MAGDLFGLLPLGLSLLGNSNLYPFAIVLCVFLLLLFLFLFFYSHRYRMSMTTAPARTFLMMIPLPPAPPKDESQITKGRWCVSLRILIRTKSPSIHLCEAFLKEHGEEMDKCRVAKNIHDKVKNMNVRKKKSKKLVRNVCTWD